MYLFYVNLPILFLDFHPSKYHQNGLLFKHYVIMVILFGNICIYIKKVLISDVNTQKLHKKLS